MNINNLIAIIKKKIENEVVIENIKIEDKSFLHKSHSGNDETKFHIKISLKSLELSKMTKLKSNKKIYRILDNEIKNYIHSLQIFIT